MLEFHTKEKNGLEDSLKKLRRDVEVLVQKNLSLERKIKDMEGNTFGKDCDSAKQKVIWNT